MLISFSVQNYRSFAERQTISMVASVGAKRKEQFSFPSGNSFAPYVLRSACLFGPNGAGKSSLVEAFHFFRNFTISSAKDTQEGEKIDVTPFLFDQKWRHRPSEFEVVFIHSGTLYQYGFAVDEDRVWSEWLFSRPNDSETKNRTLFQREFDPSDKTYYWRINRKNVKGAKELWKNSTRDNALYLSTAIQLKSSAFNDIYHWIRTHFQIIRTPERLTPSFTAAKLKEEEWRTKILDLVRAVDIKIKSVEIHEHDAHLRDILLKLPEKTRNELVKKADGGGTISVKRLEITSYHRGTDGELVGLDFNEESDGSRVIFSLAGPWLDVLEKRIYVDCRRTPQQLASSCFKISGEFIPRSKIQLHQRSIDFYKSRNFGDVERIHASRPSLACGTRRCGVFSAFLTLRLQSQGRFSFS